MVGGAKYENVHLCAQNTPALQAKFQQELKFSTQSTLCCSRERMQQGANILDKLVQPSFFVVFAEFHRENAKLHFFRRALLCVVLDNRSYVF